MSEKNKEVKEEEKEKPVAENCGEACEESADAVEASAQETAKEQPEAEKDAAAEELAKAKAEAADYKDKWIRSVAEFENFRKRNAETRHTSYMEGRADILVKLFPVGDNLERALSMCDDNTKKGIEMVLRSFRSLLEGEGVETIDPAGEEFDPKYCEAIMSEPAADGVEPGYVKEVFLKGYKKGEKVLRFAQVKVTS